MKESLNTMTFTHDPANSVPYDQVTRELILEWILNNLGSEEVTRVQNYVSGLVVSEQTLHAEQLAARQAAESVTPEE
jgi:aromatic ring hydroxylase